MGRMYKAAFESVATGTDADQDIWIIQAGANTPLVLHSFQVTSNTTSDTRLATRLLRRTTLGTGGSGETENPTDGNNTDVADAGLTTLVTAPGTADAVLDAWQWSQLVPLDYLPTPEMRILVPAGGFIALHLQTDPESASMSGSVTWEEF